MSLKQRLQSGLVKLGLNLHESQINGLLHYLVLLEKWNKIYNLTAISAPQQMLCYHLLDSLSVARWIKPQAIVLDVGSGAGLPGIPLAIAKPNSHWRLLDSNGKKTRFMQQALAVCGVKNAVVIQSRVEDYEASEIFDVIISRAYASLSVFIASVTHLMRSETVLMAMKTGNEAKPTIKAASLYEQRTYNLQVPGVIEPRKLITVKQR